MVTRKVLASLAALSLVAVLVIPALADDTTPNGPGQGYYGRQLTPEQVQKLDKARSAFLNETLDLRKQIATKNIELRALESQENADPAKVKTLQNELVDLRSQMAKKANDFAAANPDFRGMGRGYGMGFGRGGRGGYGPGACNGNGPNDCPGYGAGYGRGGNGRGGYGPGSCWR
ncbi:MAG: periplasmic heavy metal sensor [Deltaproteobacteria bacterium]|nr:periplasmic heavy metal sensor [Deltaproteobacteria bacterium]